MTSMKNALIALILVFFFGATMVFLADEVSTEYSQPLEEGFMANLQNSSDIEDIFVNNISQKLNDTDSIGLVTVGGGILTAGKVILNLPSYTIKVVTAMGTQVDLPRGMDTLINVIVWITVIFAFIYFVVGRRL